METRVLPGARRAALRSRTSLFPFKAPLVTTLKTQHVGTSTQKPCTVSPQLPGGTGASGCHPRLNRCPAPEGNSPSSLDTSPAGYWSMSVGLASEGSPGLGAVSLPLGVTRVPVASSRAPQRWGGGPCLPTSLSSTQGSPGSRLPSPRATPSTSEMSNLTKRVPSPCHLSVCLSVWCVQISRWVGRLTAIGVAQAAVLALDFPRKGRELPVFTRYKKEAAKKDTGTPRSPHSRTRPKAVSAGCWLLGTCLSLRFVCLLLNWRPLDLVLEPPPPLILLETVVCVWGRATGPSPHASGDEMQPPLCRVPSCLPWLFLRAVPELFLL